MARARGLAVLQVTAPETKSPAVPTKALGAGSDSGLASVAAEVWAGAAGEGDRASAVVVAVSGSGIGT